MPHVKKINQLKNTDNTARLYTYILSQCNFQKYDDVPFSVCHDDINHQPYHLKPIHSPQSMTLSQSSHSTMQTHFHQVKKF